MVSLAKKYFFFRDLTVRDNEVNAKYTLTDLLLNRFKKDEGETLIPLYVRWRWQLLYVPGAALAKAVCLEPL